MLSQVTRLMSPYTARSQQNQEWRQGWGVGVGWILSSLTHHHTGKDDENNPEIQKVTPIKSGK